MSYKIPVAELEVDTDRGVIWVHGVDGSTKLRVCSLAFVPTEEELRQHGTLIDVIAKVESYTTRG